MSVTMPDVAADMDNPWCDNSLLASLHRERVSRSAPQLSPCSVPHPSYDIKPLLVLDLDGTLLDTARPFVRHGAYTFLVAFDDVDVREVRLRPGLAAFLEAVMPHFELAIFTAATAAYAEEMAKGIDALVPGFRSALKAIFSKEHAHITPDGYVTKTLALLADHVGKPLCRTLIVDDNPTTYRLNVSNVRSPGVRVKPAS